MARRIGIVVLVTVAVLGVLVAGVLLFATSETGAKLISDKLRDRMKQETGLDLSFTDIDLDFFPPRIRVSSVQAGDKQARVSCTVDEAEFAPRPLELFKGELAIEEVYVGSPKCVVMLDSADIDYLAESAQKKGQGDATELDLSKLPDFDVLAISSAEITLEIKDEERLGNLRATIRGLGLDVTGGEAGIEVRGLIESAEADWSKKDQKVNEVLDHFGFRAAVKPKSIDIRHLNLMLGGSNLQARKAHLPIPFGKKTSDIADVSVSVPLELLNRLPLDLEKMEGTAAYIGQLSFEERDDGGYDVFATGRASLDQGAVGEFVIGDVIGEVSYSPKGVVFTETKITTADGTVDVSGSIAFDEKLTTELDANLHGIELGHLLEQVTVSGSYTTQKITGPARLKGTLTPLRLRGNVEFDLRDHTTRLDSFRAKNPEIALYIPKAVVRGPVEITDRHFETKGLKVQSGSSDLKVDMRINFDDNSWRLHARSRDMHLDDVKEVVGFEVGGHGPVNCLITGYLDDPIIRGTVALDNPMFYGLDFDKAAMEVTFQGDTLAFSGMSLKRGKSKATVTDLVLDFGQRLGMRVSTKIEAEGVHIKDLEELFDIDTSPYGSPSGELLGRVAIDYYTEPERLRVDADILHENMVVFGERFGAGPAKIYYDKEGLEISQLELPKGDGSLSITGNMREDGSIAFIGVATNIDTEQIDNPSVKELGIETVAEAFVVVEGTVDHPKGFADFETGETSHNKIRYGSTKVAFQIDGNEITATGNLLGDKLVLEHSMLNMETTAFEVETFIRDLDVLPILDIDTYGNRASLRVTGDVALFGSNVERLVLNGHATMNSVNVALNDVTLKNKKPLEIEAIKSQFQVARTRFSGSDVVFDVKGVFGLKRLNIDIKGLADIRSMSAFVDGIARSEGRVDFEVGARGAYASPSLRGSADLKEGLIVLDDFPHRIERIRGKMLLSPQLIQFKNFTAACAEGSMLASGELRIADGEISDYQFRLKGEDLNLRLMDDVVFTATTVKNGLVLKSPDEGGLPTVTGDVEIANLRYTEDIRILDWSELNVDRLAGRQTRASRPKLFDETKNTFAYDVNLHGKRNLKARNNIFDVDLSIDDVENPLRIVGTNQTFGFLGRVLGRPGQVRFAGKRFDIKYASIDFQDELRPENPYFYVTADGQVRDWQITLTAEGTADEYEIKLASQPYLPQEDIIFVILTGLTRTEHGEYGISLGAPILGQLGPGGDAIPLELRIYKEYSEKADTETTRLALGRWLTPKVWVSVSSSVGEQSDVEAALDYRINDKFSLSAGYDDDNEGSVGNVGVDLKFRLEF